MELQLKRDRLQEVKEGIKVGDLFFDKRGEEIIRIQEIEEKQYRKRRSFYKISFSFI